MSGAPHWMGDAEFAALSESEKRDQTERQAIATRKFHAERRMALVDSWPKELRELVHEYGHAIVKAFTDVGVRKPNQIRMLVALCRHETADGRPADFGNQRDRRAYAAVTRHHDAKAKVQS